jgi:flagellar hook-basal body complex protein FliE
MKEITVQSDIQSVLTPGIKGKQTPEKTDPSFGAVLKGTIDQVNKVQTEADQAIQELAAGNEKDIHQTMIALEKAEVSFQLMMQVRNKIISAYEEIMRMQV